MRFLLPLFAAAALSLTACADPEPDVEPDVTGTIEAGGASTDGTLDEGPVEPTDGDLDPGAMPDDSIHAGL